MGQVFSSFTEGVAVSQDPDPISRKKVSAVPKEKLREFHPRCVAVANAGSEIFLLIGNETGEGLQKFKVIRTFDAGNLGKVEEDHAAFDAVWRCPALMKFKALLDDRPGGYASFGFLSCRDTPEPPR